MWLGIGAHGLYSSGATNPQGRGRNHKSESPQRPTKVKGLPEQRNKDKYCWFQKDYGHNTNECFKLKVTIEKLIERGHLAEFVADGERP